MDNDLDLTPPVDAPPASETEVAAEAAPVEASTDHVIEHRSFARADANAPMPVTVITTRDSLNTGA